MDRGPDSVLDFNPFFARENPYKYSKVQDGFVTFGFAEIADWVGRVTTAALKAAWYRRWLVHRRLRPEEFGGRVHHVRTGTTPYPIHAELLHSPVLDEVQRRNASQVLPQAYPEGAPLHPARPSGHATVAGASSVILKACFDESGLIPDCVHASPDGQSLLPCPSSFAPTVGAEVNKLAFNIAMGRDWAGIH